MLLFTRFILRHMKIPVSYLLHVNHKLLFHDYDQEKVINRILTFVISSQGIFSLFKSSLDQTKLLTRILDLCQNIPASETRYSLFRLASDKQRCLLHFNCSIYLLLTGLHLEDTWEHIAMDKEGCLLNAEEINWSTLSEEMRTQDLLCQFIIPNFMVFTPE